MPCIEMETKYLTILILMVSKCLLFCPRNLPGFSLFTESALGPLRSSSCDVRGYPVTSTCNFFRGFHWPSDHMISKPLSKQLRPDLLFLLENLVFTIFSGKFKNPVVSVQYYHWPFLNNIETQVPSPKCQPNQSHCTAGQARLGLNISYQLIYILTNLVLNCHMNFP